jgi:hypothetical protein
VTIDFPVNLTATVSGGTPTSVQFIITKVDGGYSKTINGTGSGSSWTASWNDSSGGNGEYSIKARAIINGLGYDSASSTVEY